ncbi:MAG TPA: HEAT repeat domain-containing protein [Gemmatimonadales bacterium]|nr:HEAT repeat domain-containing protein [Gemmatimonadales bacterium]
MTAEPASTLLPASHVTELIQGMVKALRAFQMYLPNNPIHQRAIQNVRAALTPIWAATEELVFTIGETELIWEEQVVYRQLNKSDSLAWSLYKDGMRELTIYRGAEQEELPRLLVTINQARFMATDAGDDLNTLLWAHEFEQIKYVFIDFFSEGGGELPGPSGTEAGAGTTAAERRSAAAEEAARPKGVVDLDDFDSTLYFLDEDEIQYLAAELENEYKRDIRGAALNVLFDLIEMHGEGPVRDEVLGVLEQLFPNLLTSRDFRSAGLILRECKLLKDKASNLRLEQSQRLDGFVNRLSEAAIIGQLLQSLDEASAVGLDPHAANVLRELRASALEPLISWIPNLSSEPLRKMLEEVVDKLAGSNIAEVQRLLRQPDSPALKGVVAICGRLQLHHAVTGLAEVIGNPDPAVRLAAVQTLGQLGTPGSLTLLDRAIEDSDKAVRLAAVRAASQRGYKGALKRVEAVVLGKAGKRMDLTEKMAFFEAYGSIAGANGLKALTSILLERGLLKMKEPPEIRACAAMALGRIKTAEARDVLQRAADDKELVVRNAVNRALRETAA